MNKYSVDDLVLINGVWYFVQHVRIDMNTGASEYFISYGNTKGWVPEDIIEESKTKKEVLEMRKKS